jgi:hypothetical protein
MKSKNLILIVMLLASAFVYQSCKKDRSTVIVQPKGNSNGNTPTSYYLNGKELFRSIAPKEQKFIMNAATGISITGQSGSKFYIPANSLLHQNNSPVTGNVDIVLIEYSTKADMLFSGVTTTSGTELLESGGMFYLMAKQNGEELKAKPEATFSFNIVPTGNNMTDPMDFWRGVPNQNDSLNKINWVVKDSVRVVPKKDSQQLKANYQLTLNYYQFGYCNLDRYYDQNKPRIKTIKIHPPSSCNDTNSQALITMKQYNACGHCYWAINNQYISTYYRPTIGEDIKVLIYRKTGSGKDDYEYASVDYTLIEDSEITYNGPMTKCTYDELITLIKTL